jgi:hypothetical protein
MCHELFKKIVFRHPTLTRTARTYAITSIFVYLKLSFGKRVEAYRCMLWLDSAYPSRGAYNKVVGKTVFATCDVGESVW